MKIQSCVENRLSRMTEKCEAAATKTFLLKTVIKQHKNYYY
jgi:hypothetical protein